FVVLVLNALGNFANGAWMLADPAGWYRGLPAAVPDFGPLNEHFVRDIGSTFVTLGAALLGAALVPAARVALLAVVTMFYVLHALVHVLDTGRGLVGPAHWTIDFPGVYVPALLFLTLTLVAVRRPAR